MQLKYIIFFFFFFSFINTQAQQEVSTHFMRNVWQTNYTNPAFMPANKWTIALPNFYYNAYHSAGSFDDIIQRRDGRTLLDLSNFTDGLSNKNSFQLNAQLQTLALAWRNKNLSINLSHTVKANSYLVYSRDLAGLLWNGNAQYIGETINIGPRMMAYAYNEIALGAAYKIDDVTLGAKFKYLSGMGDVHTRNTHASLYTSDDIYQLTINTNYSINASNIFAIDSTNNVETNFETVTNNFFSTNYGYALDLGLHYQVDDDWEIAISVLDLGKINWTDNTKTYKSEGSYTYDGIDFTDLILGDSMNIDLSLDTLETIFGFEASDTSSYTTQLPFKAYFSVNHQLNERWNFGALYYAENSPLRLTQSLIALNARFKVLNRLTLGANYALRNNEFNNFGLNFDLQLGPVQLFGMTDNIIGIIAPTASRRSNARFGLNLLFGEL